MISLINAKNTTDSNLRFRMARYVKLTPSMESLTVSSQKLTKSHTPKNCFCIIHNKKGNKTPTFFRYSYYHQFLYQVITPRIGENNFHLC